MHGKKHTVRLNNVLFPVWMLMLFWQTWLLVLPGNFLIDSAVLLLSLRTFDKDARKTLYKKHIGKVFCFGLLADFIGAALLFVLMMVFELGQMGDELYLTLPALLLSAALIFAFNYFFTFRSVEAALRKRLALTFAIVTAPYTFLIPSRWIYGF